MATFYVARSEIITPLPWPTFALPFSQNEEQRGGQTFSIIPFIDSGEQPQDAGAGLSLVA